MNNSERRTGSPQADALIFDVDGVLLNVERSFPEVIRQAVCLGWVQFCGGEADCAGYASPHERVMKRHGGFNDDFDLAWALLCICAASGRKKLSEAFPAPQKLDELTAGFTAGSVEEWVTRTFSPAVPRRAVRRLCARLYRGKSGGDGLCRLEMPMLRCSWRRLPLPVGIYTGRSLDEWELARRTLGWEDFPSDRVIVSDSGILKPSPRGLEILCARMGVSSPLFLGDTASDLKAFQAFGRGSFAAIGNLLPEAPAVYSSTNSALLGEIGFSANAI
ncbi:MAG: HAD family hydrolase [Pyramidobacter sp.]|nr:HAD family hydrolase [Pyramidobacter sp.]